MLRGYLPLDYHQLTRQYFDTLKSQDYCQLTPQYFDAL